jgi:hypothetical protein
LKLSEFTGGASIVKLNGRRQPKGYASIAGANPEMKLKFAGSVIIN